CFSYAYREVYMRELKYTTGGRGSDADILNLGEIFPGESPTTKFGQFVLLYSELRSPTIYTLSDVGGVAAAKNAINSSLTTHKKSRAWGWLEQALTEGKTDLKFRLSTIADEPIPLISSKTTGENYLSRLIESNETLHSRTVYTLSDADGVTKAKAAINALPMNKKFHAWGWLEEQKDKITDLRFRLSDNRDQPILLISSNNTGVDYLSQLLASNESRL
ncbi:MAG TPA: hypothetical protein VE713_12725, partial [Pyrinomonadaceae bacterium]|nr:hypothetical protein [Pyrinomonadaceae bacterium]